MGVYKFWNPSTSQYEIIKSKSIINADGTNEYTPDDVKAIDNKIGILNSLNIATGTNTYAVSISNVSALTTGLKVTIKFTNANTGASTININSLGVKAIVKPGGTALSSGNLKANGVYTLVYDGTSFQLQGEGASGNATASDLLSGKTASTDVGEITGTIPSKGVQTYTPGTTNQTITSGQYLSGTQTILGDADLVGSNILNGKNIFGVDGTVKPLIRNRGFWKNNFANFTSANPNVAFYNNEIVFFYETDNTVRKKRYNSSGTLLATNEIIYTATGTEQYPNKIGQVVGNELTFGFTASMGTTALRGSRINWKTGTLLNSTYLPTSVATSYRGNLVHLFKNGSIVVSNSSYDCISATNSSLTLLGSVTNSNLSNVPTIVISDDVSTVEDLYFILYDFTNGTHKFGYFADNGAILYSEGTTLSSYMQVSMFNAIVNG